MPRKEDASVVISGVAVVRSLAALVQSIPPQSKKLRCALAVAGLAGKRESISVKTGYVCCYCPAISCLMLLHHLFTFFTECGELSYIVENYETRAERGMCKLVKRVRR